MQNCTAGTEEHNFVFIDFELWIYIHHTGYKATQVIKPENTMMVAKVIPTLGKFFKTKTLGLGLGHGLLFCYIVVPVFTYLNVLISLKIFL